MRKLRIFCAIHHSTSGLPGSRLWYANLQQPLVDLGHDVVAFDYDLEPHIANADPGFSQQRAFIEKNRPKLEQALLRQVERAQRHKPVDVFFSYFYSAYARPEVIHAIRDMGILTLNWFCNASYQLHLVADIAPAYDYCLVPEACRLDDYRRLGAHPIYCQEAANPDLYRPYDVPLEYDVTFVGHRYGDRAQYIRYLHNHGIDVRVWGPGWQASCPQATAAAFPVLNDELPSEILGPPLSDEELIQMYSRSKISLGFSKCGETHRAASPIRQIRLRDFEAPMSGAFYMVEYMQELEQFFDIGREIVCYVDEVDLADKIKYYLAHHAERERIRQAGRARCLRDHTWHKRFEMVFRQIGLV